MERILCLLIGYVCGLFQTGYLVGKKNNMDIRKHGSGNAGTTNAFRTMGKKAGAITLLGDLFKCVLAMLIVKFAFGGTYQDHIALLTMYGAAGCILGHNFPFFLKFKGGKGVACSVGMAAVFDWRILLICAVVFFTLFFWKHYVSLCSLTVYAVALILVIVFGQMGSYHMSPSYNYELYILMALLTALCYYRHRANISRLIKGTESKIFLSKKN